jgi:hypothetical protein
MTALLFAWYGLVGATIAGVVVVVAYLAWVLRDMWKHP